MYTWQERISFLNRYLLILSDIWWPGQRGGSVVSQLSWFRGWWVVNWPVDWPLDNGIHHCDGWRLTGCQLRHQGWLGHMPLVCQEACLGFFLGSHSFKCREWEQALTHKHFSSLCLLHRCDLKGLPNPSPNSNSSLLSVELFFLIPNPDPAGASLTRWGVWV